MPNNPINKVVFDGRTLIDLTDTTATADKIKTGYGAYGADGVWMDGTASTGGDNGDVYQDEDGYLVLAPGPGTNVSVTPLSVTENGTYSAPTGVAYSPVTVGVNSVVTATATMINIGVDGAIWETVCQVNGEIETSIAIPYDDGDGFDVQVVLNDGENVSKLYADIVYDVYGNATYEDGILTITGDCQIMYEGYTAITPHFNLLWTLESNWTEHEPVTCDMTFSECLEQIRTYNNLAILYETYEGFDIPAAYGLTCQLIEGPGPTYETTLFYRGFRNDEPVFEIEYDSDGTITFTQISSKSSSDLTVSGNTVTAPSGWYGSNASASVPSVPQAIPTIAFSSNGLITATAVQTSGYVSAGTKTSTYSLTTRSAADMTVNGSYVTTPSGYYSQAFSKAVNMGAIEMRLSKTFTSEINVGINSDYGKIYAIGGGGVTSYADVSISSGYIDSQTSVPFSFTYSFNSSVYLPTLAATTYTPTETAQTIDRYQWLTGSQTIAAISNTYVGTGIDRKSSADLTVNGSFVNGPAGYYSEAFSKSVQTGTAYVQNYLADYGVQLTFNSATGVYGVSSISFETSLGIRSIGFTPGYFSSYTAFISGTLSLHYAAGSAQLPTLATATYIPSSTNQYISSYKWLTGSQTIAGDANLVPSNIKSGVSIFGVNGTMEEGIIDPYYKVKNYLASRSAIEVDLIENAREYFNSLSEINTYQMAGENIYAASSGVVTFSNVSYIKAYGFARPSIYLGAYAEYYSFPSCTTIDTAGFANRMGLAGVNFPICSKIGTSAFSSCHTLRSISFPICTQISSYAFSFCSSLTTVDFPSCTRIDGSVFNFCYSLATISFPVCSYIGEKAFYYCSSLEYINLPECSWIAANAFYSCTNMSYASLPECSHIDLSGFFRCSNLQSVYIPKLRSVRANVFQYCSMLISISLPSCSTIDTAGLANCYSLTDVYIPKCERVYSNAFAYCSNLSTIILQSCQSIYSSAFERCGNLYSVYLLSNSVTTLGTSNAFYYTPLSAAGNNKTYYIGSSRSNPLSQLSTVWGTSLAIDSSTWTYPTLISASWYVISTNYDYTNAALLLAFYINGSWVETNWTGGASTIINGHYWNMLSNYSGYSYFMVDYIPENTEAIRLGIYNNAAAQSTTLSNISGAATIYTIYLGSIYVPASLYESYKTATNWTTYSRRFVSLTDAQIAALTS